MSRFNTGNPIGSGDVKDLSDNAKNLDVAENSVTDLTWRDRFGRNRKTMHGIEVDSANAISEFKQDGAQVIQETKDQADRAIANFGFFVPVPYSTGMEVETPNFTVTHEGVTYAAQAGQVPFTTGEWDESQWHPIQNEHNDNKLLIFQTLPEAESAANTLPDGQILQVVGDGKTYSIINGVLQYENLSPINGRALIDSPLWWQKHILDVNLHNDDGTGEIYPGASRAVQGLAILDDGGVTTAFLTQRPIGTTNNGEDERCRVLRVVMVEDGSEVPVAEYSNLINIGHGEALGGYIDSNGGIKLYSSLGTQNGFHGTNARKGVSRIDWIGAETSDEQVTQYPLFGKDGSGHRFQNFNSATVGASDDGRFLVLVASNTVERDSNTVFVYDRIEVESAEDSLLVNPVTMFRVKSPQSDSAGRVGVSADKDGIYIVWGTAPTLYHGAQVYDWNGKLVKDLNFDDARQKYSQDQLLGSDGNVPVLFELEGASIYRGQLYFVCMEGWRTPGSVVSWMDGRNYACIANTPAGATPYERSYWVPTNLPATDGAFSYTATYTRGSEITRYRKSLFALSGRERPGYTNVIGKHPLNTHPFPVHFGRGSFNTLTYRYPGIFRIMGWNEITNSLVRTEEWTADGYRRLWDTSTNAEYNKWGSLRVKYREGSAFISIQAYAGDEPTGARTLWFGGSDSELPGGIKDMTSANAAIPIRESTANGQTTFRNTVAGTIPLIVNHAGGSNEIQKWQTSSVTRGAIYSSTTNFQLVAKNGTDLCLSNSTDDGTNSSVIRWRVSASDNSFRPGADNAYSIGTAPARPSQIFSATGTINTSDGREKSNPQPIDDSLLDAWGDVGFYAWQWLKSVREKGDEARIHYGPIAQHIRDALVKNGYMDEGSTDCKHAPLCYDEWEDQYEPVMAKRINDAGEVEEYDTGENILILASGNRWGIRADQCLFLEAAYQRRRADRIEARLALIEAKFID